MRCKPNRPGTPRFATLGGRGIRPYLIYLRSGVGNSRQLLRALKTEVFLTVPELIMESYRRNVPHVQTDCNPYFITFVTKFRWTMPMRLAI